ncbi:META domain-containing protein [Propionicimonas paludicola]|uniref:META domain-containing protein n=1 Tax=Propionicimonas paludicola TaxID=185243 RepID=A0A2A9CUV8_9ACTN|nr:META domain-containing protein [Propionicimonas paludicola]PFG18223.1 META domain-containing protein [Propionicimonas paludicola]
MNDLERTFREGLRQAVADRPGGVRVDIDEVIARASSPDFVPETRWTPPRWLAAAAAVLVVAGLGVTMVALRPSAGVPAVPSAPSPTASPSSWFDPSKLIGSRWSVIQLDGQPVAAKGNASEPSVTFTSETKALTNDGCNTGQRSYRFAPRGVLLDFSFAATGGQVTDGCDPALQKRFAKALDNTVQARLSADLLEFFGGNDEAVMRLVRADGTQTKPTPTPNPTNSVPGEIGVPSATPTPTEPPVATSSPTAGVHVRIYNDTGVTVRDVKLGFQDGLVIREGAMAPGTYSEYMGLKVAYRLASLEAKVDGHPYRITPIDYVGEQPLEPGNYTYRIRLTEGVMFLEFGQD